MKLYLTGSSVLNSEYKDSDGKTVYKVSTPYSMGNRTATISRLIHSPSIENAESEGSDVLEGRFVHLARIEFRHIAHSAIHFKGKELDTTEVFRTEGWRQFAPRVFTASDGKEYKWILGRKVPSLILNDGTKQPIARCERKGWFSTKPVYFEVYPEVETDMVDEIFVSFIYIEKIRRDKERAG